ncbi:hypothetical protein [uncultured Acetobacterium sp.]|nr:hypothetical protein [uncultured Acetobacterium sp.]
MACAYTNINIWVFPFEMLVPRWHRNCDCIEEIFKTEPPHLGISC